VLRGGYQGFTFSERVIARTWAVSQLRLRMEASRQLGKVTLNKLRAEAESAGDNDYYSSMTRMLRSPASKAKRCCKATETMPGMGP